MPTRIQQWCSLSLLLLLLPSCHGGSASTPQNSVVVKTSSPTAITINQLSPTTQISAPVNPKPTSIQAETHTKETPVVALVGLFAAAKSFPVGDNPSSVASGDFNRDGFSDLATANIDSNNVSVLLGDGKGSFAAAKNILVGDEPESIAVGDFNNDGKLDFVTANASLDHDPNDVSVLLGDGKGGFSKAKSFLVGKAPVSVVVSDFNGDGKQDLAVSNINSDDVSVLLGNGKGGFAKAKSFLVGERPISMAVGDFNNDGNPDLVTPNYDSNNVSVLLGDGKGGFATENFNVGPSPGFLVAGDFNKDRFSDFAVILGKGIRNINVLLGDQKGGFAAPAAFSAGEVPLSIVLSDFDGDGNQDLAAINVNSRNVSVLLGDGVGSLGKQTVFSLGINPNSAVVSDFNGDGKSDLAITNGGSNDVSVLLSH